MDTVLFVTNTDENKNAGKTFLGQIKGAICPGNSLLTWAHVEEKGIGNQGPFPQFSFRLSQLEVVSRPMDQLFMWSSVSFAQAQ